MKKMIAYATVGFMCVVGWVVGDALVHHLLIGG